MLILAWVLYIKLKIAISHLEGGGKVRTVRNVRFSTFHTFCLFLSFWYFWMPFEGSVGGAVTPGWLRPGWL